MLGPPKCSKHKSLAKPQKNARKKDASPKEEEQRNHGKSFLTICNSSISLPSVHTHILTCAWYAKSACAAATPPTLTTNLAMNIFAQNGSRLQTVCLALHTSRRWRETFYLGILWRALSFFLSLRLINECRQGVRMPRLPAARRLSSSPSSSSSFYYNNFDNFSYCHRKSFALAEMIDDSR